MEREVLGVSDIYIGDGHHSHRLPTTRWSQSMATSWFPLSASDIRELAGKTLVCDCPSSEICHGDVIALEWARALGSAESHVAKHFCGGIEQHALVTALQSMFPNLLMNCRKLPFIQDIVSRVFRMDRIQE